MKFRTPPEFLRRPEMDSDDFRKLLSEHLADLDLRLVSLPDGSAVIIPKESLCPMMN